MRVENEKVLEQPFNASHNWKFAKRSKLSVFMRLLGIFHQSMFAALSCTLVRDSTKLSISSIDVIALLYVESEA